MTTTDVTAEEVARQLTGLQGVIDRAQTMAAVLVAGTQVRYLTALQEYMARVVELEDAIRAHRDETLTVTENAPCPVDRRLWAHVGVDDLTKARR